MKKTYLVIGSSRGIGEAVARHLLGQGHRVIGVSRTRPATGEWIQADISTAGGIRAVAEGIGDTPLDGLLFMGGVWEKNAFTSDYSFEASSDEETRFILAVNLVAPIEITRVVLKNLGRASAPRAIYMGSLSGLEQEESAEVANTASKFGLRGAIHALRRACRVHKIGFTVINPGNVGTAEVCDDIEQGSFSPQVPIPLSDICATVDWILALSDATDVDDVNLLQLYGGA